MATVLGLLLGLHLGADEAEAFPAEPFQRSNNTSKTSNKPTD
jgi:hypothetical protein